MYAKSDIFPECVNDVLHDDEALEFGWDAVTEDEHLQKGIAANGVR